MLKLCEAFLEHIKDVFPWKSFLKYYTNILIRTHFKKRYQKALQPFREQEQLVKQMHTDPLNLYILPWGVGTGKTSMLPPLSTFYAEHGLQTLYCVPYGPVRDQSAALLYRCGIPFAYVVRTSGTLKEQFEIQPSYHCGDGKVPQVLVVDPDFVRYYTSYIETLAKEHDSNVRAFPPDVYLPSKKKRYSHFAHHLIWNPQHALLLDEPCEEDTNVHWVLNRLPKASVVMSATSWNLVTEDVQSKYKSNHGSEPKMVAATTIGVSTTLVAHWLPGKPVLSPFSGVKSREDFVTKYETIKSQVLWKRFLSANVLLDWATRYQKLDMPHQLSIAFDLQKVSFDSICEKALSYCEHFIAHPEDHDDAFFESFFAFSAIGDTNAKQEPFSLGTLLEENSSLYMGGCVIGTPTVVDTYRELEPMLADFPSLTSLQTKIDAYKKSVVAKYIEVKKMPISKRSDLERKQEKIREIESKCNTQIPIPESMIVNTAEYLEKHEQVPESHGKPPAYIRPQQLEERGEPSRGLDGWELKLDVMSGSFWRSNEDALKWRWKAVGSILDDKEFNMKNINDLERGYVGFMLIDKLGAQGLNLKIRHGILVRGKDGGLLPASTCLQVAGRVGRWGQDDTGYVHLTDEELFWRIFS